MGTLFELMKGLFSKDREIELEDKLGEARKERDRYRDRFETYKDKYTYFLIGVCAAFVIALVAALHACE